VPIKTGVRIVNLSAQEVMKTFFSLPEQEQQAVFDYMELLKNKSTREQTKHYHKTKPDALSSSRAIDYTNKADDNELAFTDVTDAANFGKQLRTESWQRNNG
jgi:hypothetical protein